MPSVAFSVPTGLYSMWVVSVGAMILSCRAPGLLLLLECCGASAVASSVCLTSVAAHDERRGGVWRAGGVSEPPSGHPTLSNRLGNDRSERVRPKAAAAGAGGRDGHPTERLDDTKRTPEQRSAFGARQGGLLRRAGGPSAAPWPLRPPVVTHATPDFWPSAGAPRGWPAALPLPHPLAYPRWAAASTPAAAHWRLSGSGRRR